MKVTKSIVAGSETAIAVIMQIAEITTNIF
jgi:hypothetical protein